MLAAVTAGFAATAVLRNNAVVRGEILAKTDDHAVIQQADGVVTCAWRHMKTSSFKRLHPDLYHKLVTQAMQRAEAKEAQMRAQGLVKHKGKWIDKGKAEELHLAAILLKVRTREDGTNFKFSEHSGHTRYYTRSCWSEVEVELEGLNPEKTYTLKTTYTPYVRRYKDTKSERAMTPVTRVETIGATQQFEVAYTTEELQQTRYKLDSGWNAVGARDRGVTGMEPCGMDVSVWLNDALVYEKQEGKSAVYHHVRKR
jgi:hypothetical protein